MSAVPSTRDDVPAGRPRRSRRDVWALAAFAVLLPVSAVPQASDSDPAARIARSFYEALARNDAGSLEAIVAPQSVFVFNGAAHDIPFAGTYKGISGLRHFLQERERTITLEALEPKTFTSAPGGKVFVAGTARGTVRATGGSFAIGSMGVFDVADGKIAAFEEFTDTRAIAAAFEPADVSRGRAWFNTCVACHGLNGEGTRAMNAPNLRAQDAPYLLRQLRHFTSEVRGGVSDFYGWQMNGRAKALPEDRARRDVVAYIDQLPRAQAKATLKGGDAAAGRASYTACIACHGARAEGNPALSAPALAGLDDWYVLRQLEGFRSGSRGKHPDDLPGQQMRAAASMLADETAAKNVTAYIATLP